MPGIPENLGEDLWYYPFGNIANVAESHIWKRPSRVILDVPFAEEICDQVLLHYTPDWLEKPNLRKIIVVQGDHYYERDITIDVEYDQETVSLKFLSSDEEDDLP